MQVLQTCKDLLKQRVNAFSNFRGTARSPIAAILAISGNPDRTLENGLLVNNLLKKEFWSSTYLSIAAMTIAQLAQPSQYEHIASRTRAIYDLMKADHPFLTTSEDSVFCSLMALSEKSDGLLARDTEQCYQILKGNFFSSGAVQSLSQVLALCDGQANEKCQRTMDLFNRLKDNGLKYGTGFELPTLGVLAMSCGNPSEIAQEISEIDAWLSQQKGFGFLSSISKKQRLMYAGILAQGDYIQNDTMQTAAVSGTISLIIAQEVAMCAAIAASSTAASSAATNN
jgi:hypothetical protein